MLKRMLLICVAIVPNLTFLIYQLTYLLTILLKLSQFISVPYFALRRADECIHYRLLDRLSGFYCFQWLCFQKFFFRLKLTGSSTFTLLAKYRKNNYNEIQNQIVALSKIEGFYVGYWCKIYITFKQFVLERFLHFFWLSI